MKVLVLGAGGASGQRIVERALATGHEVTGFVRDPRAVEFEHPRLRIAAGDVTVASTVRAAIERQNAVVWAIGGRDRLRDPRRRSLGVCSVGTAHVVDAMRASGVRRLICQSSWGVADSLRRVPLLHRRIVFPLLLADELADKAAQEARVRHSDLDWTIVRPARLTDTPATGRYRAAPTLTFTSRSHVSRADVADLIVSALDDGHHIRHVVEITGT